MRRLMWSVAIVTLRRSHLPAPRRKAAAASAGRQRHNGRRATGRDRRAASPALIERGMDGGDRCGRPIQDRGLVPGTHAVTFSLTGFNTTKREDVALTASFTATVNAEMRVGALEETITVSGQTPTVDVQNVGSRRS